MTHRPHLGGGKRLHPPCRGSCNCTVGWAGLLVEIGCDKYRNKWASSRTSMAEQQQRQRLRALRNNRQLSRFVVEGRATGKQLGTGSYGSVEEVGVINITSY